MPKRRIPVEKELKKQLKDYKEEGESYTEAIEGLADSAGVSLSDGGLDEEAEQMAKEVMNASDKLDADGPSSEYLKQEYDVDAAEFDNIEQLRSAVRGSGGE